VLARPRSGYYGSLSEQAAALMHSLGMYSLAMNHPFVDGNKCVAFALTAVFLRLNGFRLVVSTKVGVEFIEGELIRGRAQVSQIASWIERNIVGV
jgi:death-on-curing protein